MESTGERIGRLSTLEAARWGRRARAALAVLALAVPSLAAGASLVVESVGSARLIYRDGRALGFTPVRLDSLRPGRIELGIGASAEETAVALPWIEARDVPSGAADRVDTLRVGPMQLVTLVSSGPCLVRAGETGAPRWTPVSWLVPVDRTIEVQVAEGAPPNPTQATWRKTSYRATSPAASLLRVGEQPFSMTRSARGSLPPGQAIPDAGAPLTEFRRDDGFRWRVIVPFAAVVGGISGVIARQQADRAYDDYKHTLDRALMADKLDRAHRYDNLSAGLWIGAEVCLIASAWLYLAPHRPETSRLGAVVQPTGDGLRAGFRFRLSPERAAPMDGGDR